MMDSLTQFHFLRPWGLLFVVVGTLLTPIWYWLARRKAAVTRVIAPHLLPHLLLPAGERTRYRPVHSVSLILVLAGLAVSGPTWERTLPPFTDEQTRVIVIVDLSDSMGENGALALAQERVQSLTERHTGWYVGLTGYARSAHLVVPASRDRDLLALYLNSLEAGMIPGHGRNLAAALTMARASSPAPSAPQTLLLFTDQVSGLQSAPAALGQQENLLVMAPQDSLVDWSDSPLKALGAEARGFSTSGNDLRWLENRIESHFNGQQTRNNTLKWRDMGYWLVWPALLVSLLTFRKGWQLGKGLAGLLPWTLILPLLLATPLTPARAGGLEQAFLTPDQQGRRAFESEDYAKAARTFQDPYLKGLSAYRAADYALAIDSFRKLDTAAAWFYLGNSYARTVELEKAKIAYATALNKDPKLTAAAANLALVNRLADELHEDRAQASNIGADDLRFDNENRQGEGSRLQGLQALTADTWLENLNTSATSFLKRKFASEQRRLLEQEP